MGDTSKEVANTLARQYFHLSKLKIEAGTVLFTLKLTIRRLQYRPQGAVGPKKCLIVATGEEKEH